MLMNAMKLLPLNMTVTLNMAIVRTLLALTPVRVQITAKVMDIPVQVMFIYFN